MQTFQSFVEEAAREGVLMNLAFEQRVFELFAVLHQISRPLQRANIAHELIGGLAVFVHVEEVDSEISSLTRDVDLMVNRSDLDRVISVATENGFQFRHVAGVDMLLYGESRRAINAIHLVFAQEKVKPSQAMPNPDIRPQRKIVKGEEVYVVPVGDLLAMKLSSNRDKDRVHVRGLDAARLITPQMVDTLPNDLRARLEHIRATE